MSKLPVTYRVMQIRAAVLSHYEEVARALDINPQPLLRKMGLSRSMLVRPTQLIPVNSAVGLLELTAETADCDTFGLMMAEARLLSDFGPISLLLMQQHTMRGALDTIAQYRHLLNESLGMHIEEEGKYTLIREEIMTNYPGGSRQSTDMAVGVLILIFRAILGPNWRPHSVHFTHAAPKDLQILKRMFRCALHFDSDFNGLMCLTTDLETVNVQADPAMASYAQSFLEAIPKPGQSSFVLDVRRSVYLLLPMGRANVDQVASGLGMNVRTLQRRLDESQASFSDILNEVRCELGQRYVRYTSNAFGRVAELLGYSNTSSFNRWFAGQFGCTPSQMRG